MQTPEFLSSLILGFLFYWNESIGHISIGYHRRSGWDAVSSRVGSETRTTKRGNEKANGNSSRAGPGTRRSVEEN